MTGSVVTMVMLTGCDGLNNNGDRENEIDVCSGVQYLSFARGPARVQMCTLSKSRSLSMLKWLDIAGHTQLLVRFAQCLSFPERF